MKNLLTTARIEPVTFRFVAQHLNHCATAVPPPPFHLCRGLYFLFLPVSLIENLKIHIKCLPGVVRSTVQLKCDGTLWRTGGEVKGNLANAVGSQYPSHYLGTWCIQHYYRWCAQLGCQQSAELTFTVDLNGLVRLAERRNLVSARVTPYFELAPTHYSLPDPLHLPNSIILSQSVQTLPRLQQFPVMQFRTRQF